MNVVILLTVFIAYSWVMFSLGRMYEEAVLVEEYEADLEAEELKDAWNASDGA